MTIRMMSGAQLAEALPYVDVLMPNEREACKIARTNNFEDAIRLLNRDGSAAWL